MGDTPSLLTAPSPIVCKVAVVEWPIEQPPSWLEVLGYVEVEVVEVVLDGEVATPRPKTTPATAQLAVELKNLDILMVAG